MSEHPPTYGFDLGRPRPPGTAPAPWINLILFVLTLATTIFAGTYLAHFDPDLRRFWTIIRHRPELLQDGLPFAGCLLAILGAHELGHYFLSRHHRVDCSLPYFLPGPNLVGTFGAVIMMRSRVPHRNALFDIGAAGPLMGLIVAVFTMVMGFLTAVPDCLIVAENQGGAAVLFHPNLLMSLAGGLTGGGQGWETVADCGPHGLATLRSPLLDAAAVGFLVTTLNLLPLGQLDGGHISFAVFGRRARWVSLVTAAGMAVLGWFWPPWLLMGALLLALMGRKTLSHPPPADPAEPLSTGRKVLAVLLLVLFVLIIAPVPLDVIEFGY